uniref:Uncharacterized protein n=1 Tax=Meloidogyne incognita TaxID=6306 RepID=A0A914NT30_MELIC
MNVISRVNVALLWLLVLPIIPLSHATPVYSLAVNYFIFGIKILKYFNLRQVFVNFYMLFVESLLNFSLSFLVLHLEGVK